jgi:UDP-N-acetylmuramate dehydrogenase
MVDIQQQVILAPYTTFGIGGPADFFVVVNSSDQLIEAVNFAKQKGIPFFVLGTGANILIGDKGFRGLVIKNEAKGSKEAKELNGEVLLTVESGETIAKLIYQTVENGLSGLEHFAGIPSSVGGALWQNLHFLSPDRNRTVFIAEILEEAEVLRIKNQELRIKETVGRDYFKFGYDYSSLHDSHDVVLAATFRLVPEDREVLKQRVQANLSWRKEKHPDHATTCSAGSVFKKIEGSGAGRLIEKVGLKGKQIGGAKISEKHANFIINIGNATAADVRTLIDLVQQTVKTELGLHLETEISFVGEF